MVAFNALINNYCISRAHVYISLIFLKRDLRFRIETRIENIKLFSFAANFIILLEGVADEMVGPFHCEMIHALNCKSFKSLVNHSWHRV